MKIQCGWNSNFFLGLRHISSVSYIDEGVLHHLFQKKGSGLVVNVPRYVCQLMRVDRACGIRRLERKEMKGLSQSTPLKTVTMDPVTVSTAGVLTSGYGETSDYVWRLTSTWP
ncbi:hypothetical protein AVEN_8616-1 [Araneus ventricosus]|uniref:Uncharacterized protein n=1 Tax=Araneus ventricosus TaxID=182803 RepID=A0A4Y2C2S6_ARAVE|nr:hypothetical protein AVEN_8616-1 [Araneus ventricosus]